jgi:large subunit ribosomal protein L13
MIIYDAENQILGRLSSVIAKQLLKGEKIFVVNAEKTVVAGNPRYTMKKYLQKIQRGGPLHGPFFPRWPDQIFRRTVRGMLPWDRTKGRKAYKNLKVFIGLPEEFKNKKLEKLNAADANKLKCRHMSLSELSATFGVKKRW